MRLIFLACFARQTQKAPRFDEPFPDLSLLCVARSAVKLAVNMSGIN